MEEVEKKQDPVHAVECYWQQDPGVRVHGHTALDVFNLDEQKYYQDNLKIC